MRSQNMGMIQHQMGSVQGTFQDIGIALSALDKLFPMITSILSLFNPAAAAALQNLKPLIGTVGNAVNTVASANGGNVNSAVQAVISHNTPGQPNAPALDARANPAAGNDPFNTQDPNNMPG